MSLGDLMSEERRDILLHLTLSASHWKEKDTILKASLRYFNLINSTIESAECKLEVNRTGIIMIITLLICDHTKHNFLC